MKSSFTKRRMVTGEGMETEMGGTAVSQREMKMGMLEEARRGRKHQMQGRRARGVRGKEK